MVLTEDQLKEKYKEIIGNKDLVEITRWTETNTSIPTNEEAFKKKIINSIDAMAYKIHNAISQ